jgi:hypothetical protein
VPSENVLRVTLFSQLDPEQMARMLVAGGGGLAALTAPADTPAVTPGSGRLIDVVTGDFKIGKYIHYHHDIIMVCLLI